MARARGLMRKLTRILRQEPAPVILMYHRIAEPVCDPWDLCVAPELFAEQMDYLRKEREPLSMDEFVERLERRTLPPRAVAVTFDDGYRDNLTAAKPVLDAFGVPASIFLTTGRLGADTEYWWDELARLILSRREPLEGTIPLGDISLTVRLDAPPGAGTLPSHWRASRPPATQRERLYLELWRRLRLLPQDRLEATMAALRTLCGGSGVNPDDLPLGPEEARRLIQGSLIRIGGHAVTHQPLTALPVALRRKEIAACKEVCEALAGQPVTGFAYPYGDRDPDTIALVGACGFAWACSTRAAAVDRNHFDRFDLPRLQALNWSARELARAVDGARI